MTFGPARSKRSGLWIGALAAALIVLLELGLAYGLYRAQAPGGDAAPRSGPAYHYGGDFIQYYAVSRLILEGEASRAYDPARIGAVQAEVTGFPGGLWRWLYPPSHFLLVWPLSLTSYGIALGIWLALGAGLYIAALLRILPHPLTAPLGVLFPAAIANLYIGQNGFLTAAVLAAGLVALPRRPVLAGLLLGALSLKPQLALLLPVALAAGGQWRAMAAAAAAALGLGIASFVLFGAEPWSVFVGSAVLGELATEGGLAPWRNMPSVFAALRLGGAAPAGAWAAQILVSLGTAAAVAWMWRGKAGHAIKAAFLLASIPLATPYIQYYDLTLLLPAMAFLVLHILNEGRRPGESTALFLFWLAPFVLQHLASAQKLQLWPLALALFAALIARRAAPRALNGGARRPDFGDNGAARVPLAGRKEKDHES